MRKLYTTPISPPAAMPRTTASNSARRTLPTTASSPRNNQRSEIIRAPTHALARAAEELIRSRRRSRRFDGRLLAGH